MLYYLVSGTTVVSLRTCCIVLIFSFACWRAPGAFVKLNCSKSPFFAVLGSNAVGHSNTWWQSDTKIAKPSGLISEIYRFEVAEDGCCPTSRREETVFNSLSFCRDVEVVGVRDGAGRMGSGLVGAEGAEGADGTVVWVSILSSFVIGEEDLGV